MDRRRWGDVLLVVGTVVTVLGVVLTLTEGSEDAAPEVVAAPSDDTSATPTQSPHTGTPSPNASQTTSAPAATPSPSPTTPAPTPTTEPIEAFYPDFNAALAEHDVEFLFARLAPPVFDRYGADQCRSYLDSLPPQDTELEVIDVAGPAAWDWVSDEVVTTIPDAYTVTLERTVDGQTSQIESHVVQADGEVRWFTDCGDPR